MHNTSQTKGRKDSSTITREEMNRCLQKPPLEAHIDWFLLNHSSEEVRLAIWDLLRMALDSPEMDGYDYKQRSHWTHMYEELTDLVAGLEKLRHT